MRIAPAGLRLVPPARRFVTDLNPLHKLLRMNECGPDEANPRSDPTDLVQSGNRSILPPVTVAPVRRRWPFCYNFPVVVAYELPCAEDLAEGGPPDGRRWPR